MPYASLGDKKVYYEVNGQGEPLVILNGIMMSTISWDGFVEALSNNFTLIRIDFLDQGRSSKMDKDYDAFVQADAVKCVLDELGIKKSHISGISYGGVVAAYFAAVYPDSVNRLVLFNSVLHNVKVLKDVIDEWESYAKLRDARGLYDYTMKVNYTSDFKKRNKEWMDKREPIIINGPFSSIEYLDSFIRLINCTRTMDLRNLVQNITAPTLVVGSLNDMIMPVEEQYKLASKIKDSSIVVIPNIGHASMYETPRVFVTLLIGFLSINDLNIKI